MFNFIDIYCERTGPGFLAEPINAFTNLAFFIAAFLALLLARKEKALDWRSGILIGLIVVIGTGSTFFHTFATFWAMLSDSLPILIYQITFIIFYAWRVMGWNKWRILALLGAFFFVQYLAALARGTGSTDRWNTPRPFYSFWGWPYGTPKTRRGKTGTFWLLPPFFQYRLFSAPSMTPSARKSRWVRISCGMY